MFGQGGALNFNSGIPVPFAGSQVFGNPTQPGDFLLSEGCSSIADSSGNLLFYSNGEKVWNSLNQVMPNGDSLFGLYSSTSAALIIPVPMSDSLYYVFTTDGIERYLQRGLRYSVVNMCLDNGKGDVINSQKNVLLLDTVSEKVCAVRHPNGTDIWLITHKYFSDSFYAYLITPNGINAPVVSGVGSVHLGNSANFNGFAAALGQMKASFDGSRIGLVFSNVNPAVAEIFDFDAITGVVSNPLSLQTNGGEYGIEFSPDNSKVYISNMSGVFQFNLNAGSSSAINASKFQLTNNGCAPAPMQIGPDGKIYVSRCNSFLGVVHNPNLLALNCNYVNNGLNISPAVNNTSLPAFIAGFNYRNHQPPDCLTTGTDFINTTNQPVAFPNPFATETVIQMDTYLVDGVLCVQNIFGETVTRVSNINGYSITFLRGDLPPGLYFAQFVQANQVVGVVKLVISE